MMMTLKSGKKMNFNRKTVLICRATKIPALHNASKPPTFPSTHAQHMSEANKKHYEPLHWDGFFDELCYLDDVQLLHKEGDTDLPGRA